MNPLKIKAFSVCRYYTVTANVCNAEMRDFALWGVGSLVTRSCNTLISYDITLSLFFQQVLNNGGNMFCFFTVEFFDIGYKL